MNEQTVNQVNGNVSKGGKVIGLVLGAVSVLGGIAVAKLIKDKKNRKNEETESDNVNENK